uniref:Uncharacterized protein n=1 Tax=Oryza glaberrima TaxID=4538 RepID=I1NNI8_ORYGL
TETGGRGSTEDAGVNGDWESRSTTPDPNASSVMTHGAWVGGRACVGSSGDGHDSNNAGTLVPAPVPTSSSSVSAGRPSRRPRLWWMWLRESEAVVMESMEQSWSCDDAFSRGPIFW